MATDKEWEAIVGCDAGEDGRFYYGVSTTGIFCRPSCKSRTPNREHVRIFDTAAAAQAEGLRPCKRCRPDGLRLPDEEWAESIAAVIRRQHPERLTLRTLAEQQHASPYHLQRTFKRVRGMSPAEYLLRVRVEAAMTLLNESRLSIAEIGERVGMPSAAHFASAFRKITGQAPTQYRQEAERAKDRTHEQSNRRTKAGRTHE